MNRSRLHFLHRLLTVALMAWSSISLGEEKPRPEWPVLVDVATRHHMPFPPATAPLALVHSQTWTVVGNASHPHDPAIYHPGWVLEKRADGSQRVLMGFADRLLEPREAREPLSREFSLQETKLAIGGHVTKFDDISTFIVAIHCAQRQDLTNANALWDRFSSSRSISHGFEDVRRDTTAADPRFLLASLLFDRCEHMIMDPTVDFTTTAAAMDTLLTEFPRLATPERKTLYAQVKATAEARPAAPGSVEADLIAWGNSQKDDHGDEPPQRKAILKRGFGAIPELLRLQNDQRLTRMRYSAIMMRPSSPKPLGDLAQSLLSELLPDAPDMRVGFDSPASGNFTTAWEAARPKGELAYYLSNAWKRDREKQLQFCDAAMLVIATRYPQELHGLVKKFQGIAKTSDGSWGLVDAIQESTLKEEEKIQLLLGMTRKGGLASRRAAIHGIVKIRPKDAIAPTLAVLRTLPKDVSGPYWTSDVSSISHLVLALDDDAVWQTFFRKAQQAAVGLRLEWMNPFNYSYVGDRVKSRRLAFLAGFLDDNTLRDDSVNAKKYDGPCAAFTFRKITVRNFAAMQMASILDIDRLNSPDSTWTEAQWQNLHAKVRTQLQREGIKAMK